MTIPFLLSLGFSTATIGTLQTFLGIGLFLLGAFVCGLLVPRVGLLRMLAGVSVVVSLSIVSLLALSFTGAQVAWLAVVLAMQNLATGIASTASIAYVATLTDPRYTATQFAVLTAAATLPRSSLSAGTGWLASHIGWMPYFFLCALLALTGLAMILAFRDALDGPVRMTRPSAAPST